MKMCGQCGSNNDSDSQFCLKCGKELTTEIESKKRAEKVTSRGKTPFYLATAIILVIALFTGYKVVAKNHSEQAVVGQFITALAQKDQSALKKLIVPKDSRLKINEESMEALFTLTDKNPSMLQEIESELLKERLSNGMFSVYEKGKKYGVIPQYVIDATGYFLSVDAVGDKTVVYLKDSEIGLIEKAGETNEFGPFLAGIYTIKGVSTAESENNQDTQEVTLAGAQSKVSLNLVTAEEKTQEEPKQVEKPKEVIEKVVVKEVIREEASNRGTGYYIIPYSDYSYLTVDSLQGLSKSELRLARNEIYARYGYIFKSKDLQDYFDAQSWYYRDSSYTGNLSAVEKYNVDLIKSYE